MSSFDPRKITSLIVGSLLVFTALFSGGIYQWSRELFTFAVAIAFAVSLLGRETSPTKKLWPALALLGVTYLSILWTISVNDTLDQAFSLTAYVMFAFLAASAAGGARREAFLRLLVITATAVSVYAVYQYFVGFAHTEEYLASSGLTGRDLAVARAALANRRAFSTLLSPNVLACYLAMVFPAGLALYGSTQGRGRKLMHGAALAIILAAFLLTKSVGGFVALLSGTLVYIAVKSCAIRGGPASSGRRMVAAVLLVAALASAGGYFILSHRSSGFFGYGTSYTERLAYWEAAYKMAGESPLTGSGPGSYAILLPAYKTQGLTESRYAHNVLLQALAETGIPGAALVLLLFGVFFYRGAKTALLADGDAYAPAVLAGGAAFLVQNLLDFTYYIPETAVLFWFYFGMNASQKDEGASGKGGGIARAIMAALLIVFGFYYSKAYLAGQRQAEALEILRVNGITSAAQARSVPPPPDALRLAEEAVALKPYDDTVRVFLAGLYEGQASAGGNGQAYIAKAEEQYASAIRLNPYYPYHYRDLGLFYLRAGDKARARAEFRHALDRYPSNKSLQELLDIAER